MMPAYYVTVEYRLLVETEDEEMACSYNYGL